MDSVFEIHVEGIDQLERLATTLEEGFDFERMLDEGAALLFNRIRTRYIQAVDPDENPWAVSKAAQIRADKGIGGLTGYDSGTLFHSLQLFKSNELERTIGTDVPYAPFFQFGARGQPERIFLAASDDDVLMLENLFI